MRRLTSVAFVVALFVGAAPLAARLCEIACSTRAEHCHRDSAPASCPEKSHGSDAPSLAAGKAMSVAADPADGVLPLLAVSAVPLPLLPSLRPASVVDAGPRETIVSILRL